MEAEDRRMKELDDIERLIIASLDQTASDEELTELYAWLKTSKKNQANYYQIKDTWEATSKFHVPDTKKAWRQLNKQLKRNENQSGWLIELVKVAAVALLVAIASYVIFEWSPEQKDASSVAKVIVPNGSQSTVILADGTSVKLNAGSELIYPSQFDAEVRQVELKGEGYFKVKHDASHPFIVSAGQLDVQVLGTEFNVMAYSDEDCIETTLVEGSVAINKKGADKQHSIILTPGQKAVLKDGELAVLQANLELETTWTQNGFYFQSTSFEELVRRLERWYDVEIVLNESDFEDLTFTGKFKNKETIWQVLDVIQMTTPISYQSKEGKIYITLLNQ